MVSGFLAFLIAHWQGQYHVVEILFPLLTCNTGFIHLHPKVTILLLIRKKEKPIFLLAKNKKGKEIEHSNISKKKCSCFPIS